MDKRTIILGGAALAAIAGTMLGVEPLSQDPAYHRFADDRTFGGIPNALNVLSNLAFVLVGGLGLTVIFKHRSEPPVNDVGIFYGLFFVGLILTGIGSGYYHISPDNATLFWDRLPMTIAFTGFFSAMLAEMVHRRLSLFALLPLLVVGAASVIYWRWSEGQGYGDLRIYVLVQFLPIGLTVVMLGLYPKPPHFTRAIVLLIVAYGFAKIAEVLDAPVLAFLKVVSGHTLKHVIAAVGAYALVDMLRRRLRAQAKRPDHSVR